jgi:hypothetical protein
MPRRTALGLALSMLALLWVPSPASAKDVCTQDGVTRFRFKGVKSLKKPGSISPLNGSFTNGSQHVPVTGTAFTRADGNVVIGVHVHAGGAATTSSDVEFAYSLVGDATLSATGSYRYLDGQIYGYEATWAHMPCNMLPVP